MPHIPIHRLPPELLDMSPKTMAQRAAQLPPHGRYRYRKALTALRAEFDRWWREGAARVLLIPEDEWKRMGGA